MKSQVEKSHYDFLKYTDKKRFTSYFYQLEYIFKLQPRNILEIGSGVGFLKKLLPENIKYFSVDISKYLSPDIIATIESLPFDDNSFEMVCCFQVLEHLPFEKFSSLLEELKRVSSKYVYISLPFANHKFMIDIYLPKINHIILDLLIPKFYKKHNFDGQHYWEIGKRGYSQKRIKNIIKQNFKIISTFTPKENFYHTFYLLEK
ncbi:MAG: class I SAM-dependent methyltransferase [Ignavibacteriaceae bacterium]